MKIKRKIQGYADYAENDTNKFFSWSVSSKGSALAFIERAKNRYGFKIRSAYFVEKLEGGEIITNERLI